MTGSQRIGRLAHTLTAFVGVATSVYLMEVHAEIQAGIAAGGLCNLGEGFQCAGAATSEYATLLGVPIAALGFGFYVSAVLVSALGWRPGPRAVQIPDMLSPLYAGAVLYSGFLAYVSVTEIGSICPACAVLYLVNALGLASVIAWAQRAPWRSVAALVGTVREWAPLAALPMAVVFVLATGAVSAWFAEVTPAAPAGDDQGSALSAGDEDALRAPHAPALGPEDAPVVIVEFSDFQCPFCARLGETLKEVQAAYPELVRVEFRQFPLEFHEHARDAALASLCADEQGKFWALHDAFFANQRGLDLAGRERMAREVGLDVDIWRDCIARGPASGYVDADRAAGAQLGVTGTPSFFINGQRFVGAKPFDEIVGIVQEELREASN